MGNPILPRAPLILALAEINFSPILAISKKIAELQEHLRHIGFPEFEAVQEEPDPEYPKTEPEYKWRFGSKNNQTAIVVSSETITLETAEYPGFDNFIQILKKILDPFVEITCPNLLKIINLRYVDLIRDLDGKKANEFIKPQFMQLGPIPNTKNDYQYESLQCETETGLIRINLIKSQDDITVPPDLEPAVLIPEEKTKSIGEKIILDMNFITFFQEINFSTTKILETFQEIHNKSIRPVFESIATQLAFECWEKEGR